MRRRRGVVLLVSLFVATMIVMLISAASVLQLGRGDQVQHFSEQDSVLAACESGYQYAQAQLQKNPAWRGEGNAIIVNTTGLTVVEDRGNVYGFLTDRGGNRSQFRIRFNYHNGNSLPNEDTTGSNRQDPANANLRPTIPYVSFNNLTKSSTATLYRAEKVGSVWKVLPSSPQPYTVPRSTCILYVEGLAGPGLSGTSPANPEPPTNAGRVLRLVTESYITRPVLSSADSAVFGASGINATVADGGKVKVEALGGATAKIRSLTGVVVNSTLGAANYQTAGDVIVTPGNDFLKNGTSSTAPAAKLESAAQQNKKWLKLKWSQVKQADPAGPSVRAGTYVWRDLPTRHLEYYAQEYDGSTVPTGPPDMSFDDTTADSMLLAGSGSGSLSLTGANMKLRIINDVVVEPQGGVTGFAIVSDPAIIDKRPMTLFAPPTGSLTGPTLTNQSGNIYLGSSLDGKGAVTAGGNLTFQGASFFETSSLQSVAIYSKGDITMLPVPPAVAAALPPPPGPGQSNDHDDDYGDDDGGGPAPQDILNGLPLPFGPPQATDVAFGGIIFAMGNFTADLGPGNLYIRGSLAAYGGNPDSQQPGAVSGTGLVSTNTANAHFVFDPAFFGQSQNLTAPGPLTRTMWAVAP